MNTNLHNEGDTLKGTVDNLAYGGDGIVRIEGFPFFVPRVAPGDEVEFEVKDVRRRYGKGLPKKLLQSSSERIEPDCPHYDDCGGCHTQHLKRNLVLKTYEDSILDALRKFGPGEFPLRKIIEATSPWNYRNRVTYQRKNGEQGYVRWTDYSTVDIDTCPIANSELNTLWAYLRPQIKDLAEGFLPYVVLRATSKGSLAVIFSVTGLGKNAETDFLEKVITNLPKNVSAFITEVKKDSRTPFGKTFDKVHGEDFLKEMIGQTEFHLHPEVFFQIHLSMAEKMLNLVLDWAKEKDPDILDVFCGTGLFSLPLAKAGKKVLGVEVNHRSILSAGESCKANFLEEKVTFRTGKAERILERLYREGNRFKTAIVDPPRKGLQKEVVDHLLQLGVEDLAYVSCSPPTMARDLKLLAEKGFSIESLQPMEMFPQTYHVEVLGFLKRSV